MKKELMNLLKEENAYLKLNELFQLHRWQLHSDTDILHREAEFLELVMTNECGKTRSCAIRITSRDFKNMESEIEKAMLIMLDQYSEKLLRDFRNGYLS